MEFDRNGFLWIVTEMGVVRFDGRNFREYNMRNSPTLWTNRCSLIGRERSSGDIVVEPAFSMHRYLRVTHDYQLRVDTTLSANPYQWHFRGYGIFTFAKLYKKWGRDTTAFGGLFNGLPFNAGLVAINEKQAYVRNVRTYFYLDENTATVQPLTGITGHTLKIQFLMGDVYILIDRQNRIYAFKDGLPQKITGSRRFMSLLGQVDVTGPYPIQASVTSLRDTCHTFLVHNGDILLLNLTNGLLDFDTLAANTPARNVNCILYDQREKIIYVGTATSGLYILKKREFQRVFFSGDNFLINSLYAQVELGDGRILTSSGILDRNSRTNIPSPGLYDRPAFLRSSDGHIWYSSYGWLKRADADLHHSDNIVSFGDISHFGIWAVSITELPDKDILCACSGPSKLFRIHGEKATLLLDARISMDSAEIMSLLPVSATDLWIGTTNGIYVYDLPGGAVTRLPGLENTGVRTIHRSQDGSIWIGIYGQGFYKYVNGSFLKMPLDAAGNLTNVHCFMEDGQGFFWLPTNRGLYRVAKNELDRFAAGGRNEVFYYYFGKSSGFSTDEFNGGCTPCGILTRDGRFSLPSLDGLVQFHPDSVTIIPPGHPVFIDRLTMDDNREIACDYFEQDQDAGPLTFFICSPYFGNPANLHLEYSIPQLDNRWHAVNPDGKLTLTGLKRGRYTLTVRKQEGYARYTYKTARWTILPYWYETIWFRLLAAAVIISILPVIFYFRYTRQVRRTELLEKKVAERTEALSGNNRVKEKMIAIILHDLRSPLRFLHLLAAHIYESHQKITGPELDEMLRKFQNATRDLYEFTLDFVVWTNAQKEGFVVRQEKIDVRGIVEEIVKLYEPGADIRNNNVLNLVPETITMTSDPHILKLLIRNLTDNANKYTLNGDIRIEAEKDDGSIRITITDNGRSMDKELVAGILNNTYQSEDENQGFGYKIILELLTKIRGRLLIDNAGDTGNRITLLFQQAGS